MFNLTIKMLKNLIILIFSLTGITSPTCENDLKENFNRFTNSEQPVVKQINYYFS